MASYEPGRYWAKITRQAMGEAGTGTPQFVLTFLIVGKINPVDPKGDLIPCPQFERSHFRTITDKTIDYFVEDLKILEYDKQSFKYLDPTEEGYVDFTDREIEVSCRHEDYQGKKNEKWGLARPSRGPNVKPLDGKGVRKLDSLFGKKLKDLGAKSTPSTAAATKAPTKETVPPDDGGNSGPPTDDIPF